MSAKPPTDAERAQRVLIRIAAAQAEKPPPTKRCICCGAPAGKVMHD